eukprot:4590685-Amphidinium_carterae.1
MDPRVVDPRVVSKSNTASSGMAALQPLCTHELTSYDSVVTWCAWEHCYRPFIAFGGLTW